MSLVAQVCVRGKVLCKVLNPKDLSCDKNGMRDLQKEFVTSCATAVVLDGVSERKAFLHVKSFCDEFSSGNFKFDVSDVVQRVNEGIRKLHKGLDGAPPVITGDETIDDDVAPAPAPKRRRRAEAAAGAEPPLKRIRKNF